VGKTLRGRRGDREEKGGRSGLGEWPLGGEVESSTSLGKEVGEGRGGCVMAG